MCYSGSCEYEFYKGDGETGCRKPAGAPCPHEVDIEEPGNQSDLDAHHTQANMVDLY